MCLNGIRYWEEFLLSFWLSKKKLGRMEIMMQFVKSGLTLKTEGEKTTPLSWAIINFCINLCIGLDLGIFLGGKIVILQITGAACQPALGSELSTQWDYNWQWFHVGEEWGEYMAVSRRVCNPELSILRLGDKVVSDSDLGFWDFGILGMFCRPRWSNPPPRSKTKALILIPAPLPCTGVPLCIPPFVSHKAIAPTVN